MGLKEVVVIGEVRPDGGAGSGGAVGGNGRGGRRGVREVEGN